MGQKEMKALEGFVCGEESQKTETLHACCLFLLLQLTDSTNFLLHLSDIKLRLIQLTSAKTPIWDH
jgi:hypothetical protein